MNLWKKTAFAGMAAAATLGMAACGSNGATSDSENNADGVTTLLMYQVGDKPENFDQLMEIANKRIEEKPTLASICSTSAGETGIKK